MWTSDGRRCHPASAERVQPEGAWRGHMPHHDSHGSHGSGLHSGLPSQCSHARGANLSLEMPRRARLWWSCCCHYPRVPLLPLPLAPGARVQFGLQWQCRASLHLSDAPDLVLQCAALGPDPCSRANHRVTGGGEVLCSPGHADAQSRSASALRAAEPGAEASKTQSSKLRTSS